ncbi:MAG: hypothetical protein MUF16_00065 [Burkholderiaceae bacterium]|jgi:hypothetical protein|nr:hypothetical protein [Burkholderiaceae bacterium]
MSDVVNERTTAYLRVAFRDKDGTLAAPSAVVYRVDCLTTGQSIVPLTAVPPSSEIEVTLTADDNAMRNPSNVAELRRVTVVATYNSSADKLSAQFDYGVKRLTFA